MRSNIGTKTRTGPKPFTWSYSSLTSYEDCPKRHYHLKIVKDVKEEPSEQILWGKQVHQAMALYIAAHKPMPPGMEKYEQWGERVRKSAANLQGIIFTEQELALTQQFMPCGYFAKDVWYRGVADVLVLAPPVALAVDWKTGKVKDDSAQLALMAAALFAKYPDIRKIRTEFVWLQQEDASTREDFTRSDIVQVWKNLWPRIDRLREAYETSEYPAKPCFLCKNWCPVKSCVYHGT